jgi:hypothetical protein
MTRKRACLCEYFGTKLGVLRALDKPQECILFYLGLTFRDLWRSNGEGCPGKIFTTDASHGVLGAVRVWS